jgi:hypothetical protein
MLIRFNRSAAVVFAQHDPLDAQFGEDLLNVISGASDEVGGEEITIPKNNT